MYWDNDFRMWSICLFSDRDWDTNLRFKEELEGNQ